MHFQSDVHTTKDVVRQAIIPQTRQGRCSYATLVSGARPITPQKMVTHNWDNLFRDLMAAVIADALSECTFALISRLLDEDLEVLEQMLAARGRLSDTYWICAFSVNQHASICGGNPHGEKDLATGLLHPTCDCGLEKHFNHTEPCVAGRSSRCELNKFDDMMCLLASAAPGFAQVVAVDAGFRLFGRAWCVAELAEARRMRMPQRLVVLSAENLRAHEADLRGLRVERMQASRPEDVQEILAKIPDVKAFNTAVQHLLFDEQGGLLSAWRDLDVARQMAETARLISLHETSKGAVWQHWAATAASDEEGGESLPEP